MLFILLHLGLLLALVVTTATFVLKAPTRPSRTLTGASFFGFVTGLPEHCCKAFIKVGVYGSGGIYLMQNEKDCVSEHFV